MEIFLHYFIFLLVSLALVFVTGHFLIRSFRLESARCYTSVFSRLFSGTVLVVILASLYYTGGKTVFVILIPAGILFYIKGRERSKITGAAGWTPRSITMKEWISMLVVPALLFCFRFYIIYNPSGVFFLPNADTLFYANLSNFLSTTGIESISFDYFGILPRNRDPYHYFDLWLNAAFFRNYSLNALTCYSLITVTLLLTIAWFGFMSLTECFGKPNALSWVLSFSFLFFSGIYLPFYKDLPLLAQSNVFTVDLFNYNKLVVIAVFMQAAALFFLKNKMTEATWMMLLLPVVFISTSVGVFAGMVVFMLRKYASDRNLRYLAEAGGMLFLLIIFFFYFYKPDQEGQMIKIRGMEGGLVSLFNLPYLKTCINIFGLTCIQLFVIFFPLLLIFIFGNRYLLPLFNPVRNNLALLVLLIFVFSMGGWAILHYMLDTVQLFSNITMVMICILGFISVQYIQKKVNVVKQFMISFLLIIIFVFKISYTISIAKPPWAFSDSYMKKASEKITGLNPRGVFIMNDSSYTNVFSKNAIFNIAGKYLAYADSRVYTYTLSVYNTPVSAENPATDLQMMERSVFYRYTERQKTEGNFKSITASQLSFINRYKIDFLITEKGVVLNDSIKKITREEITDALSGEHFYLLDYLKAGEANGGGL